MVSWPTSRTGSLPPISTCAGGPQYSVGGERYILVLVGAQDEAPQSTIPLGAFGGEGAGIYAHRPELQGGRQGPIKRELAGHLVGRALNQYGLPSQNLVDPEASLGGPGWIAKSGQPTG
jgi:hypothetical protein